jgi:hypothetical protein
VIRDDESIPFEFDSHTLITENICELFTKTSLFSFIVANCLYQSVQFTALVSIDSRSVFTHIELSNIIFVRTRCAVLRVGGLTQTPQDGVI